MAGGKTLPRRDAPCWMVAEELHSPLGRVHAKATENKAFEFLGDAEHCGGLHAGCSPGSMSPRRPDLMLPTLPASALASLHSLVCECLNNRVP